MPCNFLVKLEAEKAYSHFVIEGCSSANAMSAAIKHFARRTGLSPKQFDEGNFEGPRRVWIVSTMGLAVFEELYEISVGPVKIVNNPVGEIKDEDYVTGVGYLARLVESKPPRLLPGISEMFEVR